MEDIRFIFTITEYIDRPRTVMGNCIYYNLANGNKVKAWCYSTGIRAEVISKTQGHIDGVDLPFYRYLSPVRCSRNAPDWTQFIDKGKWNFEDQFPHTLPSEADYRKLSAALNQYIEMFE